MFLNVNGISMYYEQTGAGRPLIMVHGNGEDHTIFNEAAAVLKDHFTVYAVDSRDHGLSSKVNGLHYLDMAEDLLAFMQALDLRDIVFYGFSDGGILGLMCALKTDRIAKLIISGANMTPNGVKKHMKLIVQGFYFFSKDQQLKMMLEEPDLSAQQLNHIQCDTTVLVGSKDLVTKEETRIISNSIPHAKLRVLEGEGHGSYIVHSTKIADLILEETEQYRP
ncbi:MAG: alpha/beta hydrolase [Solobacterium sp.]|nr:alpha/beta hydrolase [Solobacterium sp.]